MGLKIEITCNKEKVVLPLKANVTTIRPRKISPTAHSKTHGMLFWLIVSLGILAIAGIVFARSEIEYWGEKYLGLLGQGFPKGKEVLTEPENRNPGAGGERKQAAQIEKTVWEKKREEAIAKKALEPNILGKVPIIMYHLIGDHEEEWMRSRDNLIKDLERFYELGYTLIPLQDYLQGKITLPKGESPIVLSFDDATEGQFKLENGEPSRDSAVGIIKAFEKDHPGFGHAATFFIDFPAPFGDTKEVKQKLQFLLDNGMEIGNHTYNHRNLSKASPELVQKELGMNAKAVYDLVGKAPESLALPYGGFPGNDGSRKCLLSGQWDGFSYSNKGVLLVGAEPAPSPLSGKFNRRAIPRIRGSKEELDKWLKELERPGVVYISPGKD